MSPFNSRFFREKKDRMHVYRVGSMRIPLHSSEIRMESKGRFMRRLKQILRRTSSSPKKFPSDDEIYEPPRRPASPKSSPMFDDNED